MLFSTNPGPQGLYDPAYEHDACGVGAVADTTGRRSHRIVSDALQVLHNLDHRGAAGSEPTSGDGAGILVQLPDELLRATVDVTLPDPRPSEDGGAPVHAYAAGVVFLPADDDEYAKAVSLLERITAEEGLEVLGWRDVPIDPEGADVGSVARSAMPRFSQVLVAHPERSLAGIDLDRIAYIVRKRAERESREQGCGLYIASLSSRTMTYKGMLTTDQLALFFPDLRDERLTVRDRRRAQQVLDEHLPELAAGAPLPDDGAQRRDQHHPRQPQPDAGPRGAARHRPVPRATCSARCRCAPRTSRTPPASTRSSSCSRWAAARCRTR